MDHFQHIPSQKLQHINRCRMHLKVITISSITNISRSHITQQITHRIPNNSKLTWPKIPHPELHMWKTWDWDINKYLLDPQRQLKTTLGSWTSTNTHVIHRKSLSMDKKFLYIQTDQTWNQHHCDHQVGKYHGHYTTIDSIPDETLPTETTYVDPHYHSTLPNIKLIPIIIQPQTLGQRLQALPFSIQK